MRGCSWYQLTAATVTAPGPQTQLDVIDLHVQPATPIRFCVDTG